MTGLRLYDVLWVGAGGFLGAIGRYLVAVWVDTRYGSDFPFATLLINVSGSFVLGIIGGAFEVESLPAEIRLGVAVGFIGAFTTFSTFTFETVHLVEGGNAALAFAYVAASLLIGFAAAALGHGIGRMV